MQACNGKLAQDIRRNIESTAPGALKQGSWPSLALELLDTYSPVTVLARAKAALATCSLSLVAFSCNQPPIQKELFAKTKLPNLIFSTAPPSTNTPKLIAAYSDYLSFLFQRCATLHGTCAGFLAANLAKDVFWSVKASVEPDQEARTGMLSSANRSQTITTVLSLSCGFYAGARKMRHDAVTGMPPSMAFFLATICNTTTSYGLLSLSQGSFAPVPTEGKVGALVTFLSKRNFRQPKSIWDVKERNNFGKNKLLGAIISCDQEPNFLPQAGRREELDYAADSNTTSENVSKRKWGIQAGGPRKKTKLSDPTTRTQGRGRVCHNCSHLPPRPCKQFWRDSSGELATCSRRGGEPNNVTK